MENQSKQNKKLRKRGAGMQKTAKDNYEKKETGAKDRNYFKQQNSDWILKRENR